MDKRTAEIAIALLEKQSKHHKVKQITEVLESILFIDTVEDPVVQRDLLISRIDVLKTLGLSNEQAVNNIRGVTRNLAVLSILDEETKTPQFKN